MPRGKNANGNGSTRTDTEWGGFIDIQLSTEQKQHFATWEKEHKLSDMDEILAAKIKVGVSFDSETDTYLATLTSDIHARANLRCVLTARAGLWERAVALAIYKHLVVLEGDWGRYMPKNGRVSEVD